MKYLKDWLERLKSRPASGDYWESYRHHEALEVLADCKGEGDWLTLSSHHNGFVREVAVRELSELPSPEALAALLERVNDWVPQVRQLANAGVQRYLVPEHTPALLHALQPLMALAERQRADHRETLAAARTVLQGAEVRDAVLAAFLVKHGKAARFLFDLLLEASDKPTYLLGTALALSRLLPDALKHGLATLDEGRVALQGNLDPCALYAPPERIRREVATVLEGFGSGPGHVFNLGHGIHPDIDPEHVRVLVDAVHELSAPYHRAQ